jgi:hypothetical protein
MYLKKYVKVIQNYKNSKKKLHKDKEPDGSINKNFKDCTNTKYLKILKSYLRNH